MGTLERQQPRGRFAKDSSFFSCAAFLMNCQPLEEFPTEQGRQLCNCLLQLLPTSPLFNLKPVSVKSNAKKNTNCAFILQKEVTAQEPEGAI